MRKHLLGLMLVSGLAGCTSEPTPAPPVSAPDRPLQHAGAPEPAPGAFRARSRSSGGSFASLPDRGELLSYGGGRKMRQSGAYTYHPVAISEAHAFNAIEQGEMRLSTPDGKQLRLQYESHEEQPDGNWTWIGRSLDGDSAVLTFGDRAVFGMVFAGDSSYRVRTDATGAWMVETDRTRLASSGGQREQGPDVLIPPGNRALAAAAKGRLAEDGVKTEAAGTAKALGFVDVVIGYSNGIATRQGSQSAAITLMSSLVALNNTAYAASGVSMRLRLVHAMQVTYPDNSDNQDALEEMTGYNADTQQPIPVGSAFTALRDARDEYGADMVAFVRAYREPEQDGCGIAWLLGMNQSGISAGEDAEFAYAVVSDGEDLDEGSGNTYFCSDYSLAHELGHVMGQAHNTQDASGRAGAHTYSYGYREAASNGFFTIMAYPSGDGQVEAPHFANPSVNFLGRPTGTASTDNARSLNLTMPIVATFRANAVPVADPPRNDVDGDGKSDLLWSRPASSAYLQWLMDGATRVAQASYSIASSFDAIGSGDFNGDGRTDVVWRNRSTGAIYIWERTATGYSTKFVVSLTPVDWILVGTGDTNQDGKDDMLWSRPASSQFVRWVMDGATISSHGSYTIASSYDGIGTGDFNGDDRVDIVWRHRTTGAIYIWLGATTGYTTRYVTTLKPLDWKLVGAGDVNLDGRDDMLWSRPASSNFVHWIMNGATITSQAAFSIASSYEGVGHGDFNGDGRADIIWRHRANGDVYMWEKRNTSGYVTRFVASATSGWQLIR